MTPERKAHMWGWALKLARSGDHIGSGSIEKELIEKLDKVLEQILQK